MTPFILATVLLAQAPQPYQPFLRQAPYQPPVSQVRPWTPPALPPGSPSLMIPMPAEPPPPPPWRAR